MNGLWRELIIMKLVFLTGYMTGHLTESQPIYSPPAVERQIQQSQYRSIDLRDNYNGK